jgi:hypothetical protein
LCTILCQQCELQGSDMAQCQTSCAYSKEPDCSDLGDHFIKGIGNRDDTYAPPPLPAEPPRQSPTCYCATLCESCKAKGSNTASCRTVCEFSELPNAECTSKCNAALHRGNPWFKVCVCLSCFSFDRCHFTDEDLIFLIFNIFHVHSSIWCAYRHKSDAWIYL